MRSALSFRAISWFSWITILTLLLGIDVGHSQTLPTVVDPSLEVRTVVSHLVNPTSIAFLGPRDFFVLEKGTGRVFRVQNGVAGATPVLDLGVNSASERGLLGIALHPDFPANPGVYLYWTCHSSAPPLDPFVPDETACLESNLLSGDTENILQVPLLANRLDRFVWNGSTLTFDHNLITLRAFQNDAAPTPPNQGDQDQPPRANHNAGVIAFGPDRKLYLFFGDQGRRGQLQNLPSGPTLTGLGPTVADDQFGGPQPDNAHFSGVILRLNDDGSAPADNPFFQAGADMGGEVGANIQRIYAYGLRNSFGMAFDPVSGSLWEEENGEDAYDEVNRVEPGMDGGWIQIMGPAVRVPDYRAIETTSLNNESFPNLQQFRWGPERIATTTAEALSRLFVLPGSHYVDPQFSWQHVITLAALGFISGRGLGPQYANNLFLGLAVPFPEGGALLRMRLTGDREKIAVDDPRLEDRVDDNATFDELTESASFVFGRNFGIVTDIETSPESTLYVVSLTQNAVYEIRRKISARGGPREPSATQLADARAATEFALSAPRANPARGSVEFDFTAPREGPISVRIYDVAGRVIRELMNETVGAGEHHLVWDGRDQGGHAARAGVYFYRLQSAESDEKKRVVLLER